jgi:CHASE3 domain sensor protein
VAKTDDGAIDPETAAVLEKNLQVIDQAIAESRTALKSEPQSAPARDSLFEALRQKVTLLQSTIALMNEMRKGNSAGAAQLVDGAKKS